MKRKVKKFNMGGIASQALTMAPRGSMGSGGGLSGLQQNAADIAGGTQAVEQGLNQIRGGGIGSGPMSTLGAQPRPIGANPMGAISEILKGTATQSANSPTASATPQPAFKKGGRVKSSKPKKATKYTRGDGIVKKGKTKGRMV
jgi:hypothetical protein